MRKLAAIVTIVASSVVVSTFLGLARQSLSPTIALLSLGCGLLAGVAVYFHRKDTDTAGKWERPGFFKWITITAGVLFALRAFCWLVFFDRDKVMVLSPNNLGDLPLHLTYINHMAGGAQFWPEEPIFAGEKLHYPIGIDLFNSLLALCGVDVCRGLIWVGLAGCALTGFALYRWGGTFTLAGFLFNGGITGFAIFKTRVLSDFQASWQWKSIPLAIFVTQRGFLYALPAGLLLLVHWREKYFDPDPPKKRWLLPGWVEVLLYSTMPLFHVHTFIFLSMLLFCWFVVGPNRLRLELAKLIGLSFAPATVAMSLVTGLFQPHSSVAQPAIARTPGISGFFDYHFAKLGLPFHIHAGWMQGRQNFRDFWFDNFGLLPVFVLALLCLIAFDLYKNRPDRSVAAFVLPSALIFVFTCFVMLAPWDWDNVKVMIWSYLAVLPFLWKRLVLRLSAPIQIASCFVLFFSGFVSLMGGIDGSHTGEEVASRPELDGIAQALKSIPINETFAAAPTSETRFSYHPLMWLGRKVVIGYEGHLWSHGIDARAQKAELAALMNGGTGWRDIANRLHTRYLFWGWREEEAYGDSKQPWKQECLPVARGDWGDIYDLQSPRGEKLPRGSNLDLLPESVPLEKSPPNKAMKPTPPPDPFINE